MNFVISTPGKVNAEKREAWIRHGVDHPSDEVTTFCSANPSAPDSAEQVRGIRMPPSVAPGGSGRKSYTGLAVPGGGIRG